MVQQLAVHPGRSHHLRVQSLLELLAQRLAQNEDAAHLDTAAGASGTGTNEHQHHQHFLGQSGPQVKIAAGKARGGDDGTHLERRLPQRLAKAVVDAVDVGRDDGNGGCNDHKVAAHLFAGCSTAEPAHQQQEVGVEVDAEQGAIQPDR